MLAGLSARVPPLSLRSNDEHSRQRMAARFMHRIYRMYRGEAFFTKSTALNSLSSSLLLQTMQAKSMLLNPQLFRKMFITAAVIVLLTPARAQWADSSARYLNRAGFALENGSTQILVGATLSTFGSIAYGASERSFNNNRTLRAIGIGGIIAGAIVSVVGVTNLGDAGRYLRYASGRFPIPSRRRKSPRPTQ